MRLHACIIVSTSYVVFFVALFRVKRTFENSMISCRLQCSAVLTCTQLVIDSY